MIWHAAQNNVFPLKAGVVESLESALRAGMIYSFYHTYKIGANILITYYTPDILEWINNDELN